MVLDDLGRLEMKAHCPIGAESNVLAGMSVCRIGLISPFAVVHEMDIEKVRKIQRSGNIGCDIAQEAVKISFKAA